MTHELNRGGARDNARLSLFGQPRAGREGVVFELVRSTTSEIPMPRMRRSRPPSSVSRFPSLYQLSTLWNVLKGDRASVRPSGCTWSPSRGTARAGDMRLAQASGSKGPSWERRIALGVECVSGRGLHLRSGDPLAYYPSCAQEAGNQRQGRGDDERVHVTSR